MQSDTYIPRRLDDQWKLGFWDADVAFPFVFFLFLGWMSGTKWGFVLCAGAGVRLMWAFGALVVLWTTIFWALD